MATYVTISPYADPYVYRMKMIQNEEGIPQAESVANYPRIPFDDNEQTFVPEGEGGNWFDSLKLELAGK